MSANRHYNSLIQSIKQNTFWKATNILYYNNREKTKFISTPEMIVALQLACSLQRHNIVYDMTYYFNANNMSLYVRNEILTYFLNNILRYGVSDDSHLAKYDKNTTYQKRIFFIDHLRYLSNNSDNFNNTISIFKNINYCSKPKKCINSLSNLCEKCNRACDFLLEFMKLFALTKFKLNSTNKSFVVALLYFGKKHSHIINTFNGLYPCTPKNIFLKSSLVKKRISRKFTDVVVVFQNN